MAPTLATSTRPLAGDPGNAECDRCPAVNASLVAYDAGAVAGRAIAQLCRVEGPPVRTWSKRREMFPDPRRSIEERRATSMPCPPPRKESGRMSSLQSLNSHPTGRWLAQSTLDTSKSNKSRLSTVSGSCNQRMASLQSLRSVFLNSAHCSVALQRNTSGRSHRSWESESSLGNDEFDVGLRENVKSIRPLVSSLPRLLQGRNERSCGPAVTSIRESKMTASSRPATAESTSAPSYSASQWCKHAEVEDSDTSGCSSPARCRSPKRKCSQPDFAEPSQTVIILDYDDTLFPTTWLREIGLPMQYTLEQVRYLCTANQDPDADPELEDDLASIEQMLAICEEKAVSLLHLCSKLSAGVRLVTLAQEGWVDHTCKNFMPKLGATLATLGIPVMYASRYVAGCEPPEGVLAERSFWSDTKQKAIMEGVTSFYQQYEGQTWKNIVSIGDGDFEREATKRAIETYFGQHASAFDSLCEEMDSIRSASFSSRSFTPMSNLSVTPHDSQSLTIRCKTVKLLDNPTAEEVQAQCSLLHRWLRYIVVLEGSVDIELTGSSDDQQIQECHRQLTGFEPGDDISWATLLAVP